MASYVVLARKWRPAQFSDIGGQAHIVRTMMNAIRAGRIHQAYLMTGSRGIGKTSIARIFSKAVRCEQIKDVDGWLTTCDQCASCKEIAAGTSVDVIEIDGASNNGVDAVREIRENAKYLPASGGRKIYIIDEVHMLTTAAFNALLKTLEEPPPHVIFIFATTEPHKIPATILSRVQRFDLKRFAASQIQTRLTEVAQAEGLQAEPGALALIARAAEGSMRDAMSILDQVIAFAGQKISTQNARESIGLIEGQTILGILNAVLGRKPVDALALVNQAFQAGHDLRVLTRSLIEFLHGAILAKIGAPGTSSLELTEEEWGELKATSALRELEELEMIFQVLHQGMDWIARSPQPKIVLDVLLIKCATAQALVYADQVNAGGSAPHSASAASPNLVGAPAKGEMLKATSPTESPSAIAPTIAPVKVESTPVVAPAAPKPAPSGPRTYENFIAHCKQTRPLLSSILEHGSGQMPNDTESEMVLGFSAEGAYYREQLQSKAYSDQLQLLTREFFGRPIRVRLETGQNAESLAAKRERERTEKEQAARNAAKNHPIISEARSLFGGELGPIELSESAE